MARERDWDGASGRFLTGASVGMLRVTLLFGSAGIALALILVPIADKQAHDRTMASFETRGIDLMATGTVAAERESYTIRRSVLQASPDAVCIIRASGSRSGSC